MTGATAASHLVALGRHADAVAALTPLLAADPDSVDLHGLMAQALLGLGDPAGALVEGNRMVAIAPDGEWGHRVCSLALARLGQHEEAFRAAHESVRLAPMSWRGHVQLASAGSGTRNRLYDAQVAARRAVELAPGEPDAHFVVGVVEQRAGHVDIARAAYLHTLRLEPDHAMARNNLTVLERPSLEDAVAGYSAALRSDPDSATARANLDIQVRRFGNRVYLASILAFFAALVVSAGSGAPSPVTIGFVALVALGAGVAGVRLGRTIPAGTRRYAIGRVGSDGVLTARLLLAAAALLAGLTACLVPGAAAAVAGLIGPLAVANVVLVLVARTRRG